MNRAAADIWSKIPWQAFAALTLVLPVLGVFAARQFAQQSSPRTARASQDMLPLMVVDLTAETTVAEKAAAAFDAALLQTYQSRAATPVTHSPIASTRRPVAQPVMQPQMSPSLNTPTTRVEQDTDAGKLPDVITVTSILAAPTGDCAIVAGRLRRTGDTVAPGWRITVINSNQGTVICENESGEVVTLRIKRAGDEPNPTSLLAP